MAAVLFRVEYAVRTGLTKPSSTSQSCVWNVPDADRAPSEPIKLAKQVWNKDQYFKQSEPIINTKKQETIKKLSW